MHFRQPTLPDNRIQHMMHSELPAKPCRSRDLWHAGCFTNPVPHRSPSGGTTDATEWEGFPRPSWSPRTPTHPGQSLSYSLLNHKSPNFPSCHPLPRRVALLFYGANSAKGSLSEKGYRHREYVEPVPFFG